MGRLGKFLFVVVIILIAFLIILYLLLDPFLEWAARKGIGFIAQNLEREGVRVIDPEFDKIVLSFPPKIAVKNFFSQMKFLQNNAFQIVNDFFVTIQSVGLSLRNIRTGDLVFTIDGAVITMSPDAIYTFYDRDFVNNQNRLTITHLAIPFRLDIYNMRDSIVRVSKIFKGLGKLARDGVTDIDIDLTCISEFVVRNKPVSGKLFLIRYGNDKKLVMDPKDFTLISDKLGERLTKSEFVAYCDNPLRMPRMLSIRNYASDKSHEEEKKIGPALPEEAYKHILWAYLLCKAYDDKFSREVTDGHEKDAVGRTELSVRTYLSAERGQSEPWERAMGTKEETEIQMDLINNSIGRGYYRKGYKERDLLQHTMKDPAVIRWHMDLAAGRKDAGKAPVD